MKYHKNTVKGSRRGSKWPAEVKTAAMCDLLVSNNLSAVARRYNVPESTLRTWQTEARKIKPEEQKSLFDEARERELRAISRKASAAANCAVEQMRQRLERNALDCERYYAARDQLETALDEDEAAGIQEKMRLYKPMGDYSTSNFARTLVSLTERAAGMLGEDGGKESGPLRIEIEILEDS